MVRDVLYLGAKSGTSQHRIAAFVRLGFDVTALDPYDFTPRGRLAGYCEWKLTPELPAWFSKRGLLGAIGDRRFDLVFVDSGSLVSLELLHCLRSRAHWIVNFNHDDPFSSRDGTRFMAYRRAIKEYDLIVVVREPNVGEAIQHGARDVMLTIRTADVVAHAPKRLDAALQQIWRTEVLFAGTWMESRGKFMLKLLDQGVPLSIRGGRWEKAPEWPALREAWKGPSLEGDDYANAIQSARICIGMLSSGNRDLHTTRSLEIPRLGSLFCATRTGEHLSMYREGEEAVFWDNADECAHVCQAMLADEPRRQRIALQGHRRCIQDDHTNDQLILRILDRLVARHGAFNPLNYSAVK